MLEHLTGFTCGKMEEALGFALQQEEMARQNRASMAQAASR